MGIVFGNAKEAFEKDPKDRRSYPTFMLPAEPPVWGKKSEKSPIVKESKHGMIPLLGT